MNEIVRFSVAGVQRKICPSIVVNIASSIYTLYRRLYVHSIHQSHTAAFPSRLCSSTIHCINRTGPGSLIVYIHICTTKCQAKAYIILTIPNIQQLDDRFAIYFSENFDYIKHTYTPFHFMYIGIYFGSMVRSYKSSSSFSV